MSFGLRDIKIVKDKVFIIALFDLLFFISPGIAVIYIFNPQLFYALDWIKLLFIACAITTPLVIVNTFIFLPFAITEKNDDDSFFVAFSLSILMSGLLLFGIALVHHFFGKTLKEGAEFIGAIEIVFMIAAFREYRKHNKR